jgi:hypothetical protein
MSKEMREYKKMYRRHRKKMIKLAKEDRDWDWIYLHNLVIAKIQHMYEYYTSRNNVWQTDETLVPIIESLKHVLDLQDELDNLFEKEIDGIKHERVSANTTVVEYSEQALESLENLYRREQELYEEIYNYIGKNMRGWWD